MTHDKVKLLDPGFLRRLERLRIQARRAFPGTMRGERRSTRSGASVEFRDFRKYEAGDDFRHIDWSIFARLEKLMLRQFVEEEDVRIDILIDKSNSMLFGEPVSKFEFALKAAAALAFLAVGSLDRVGVATFDSDLRSRVRSLRGRGHLHSILLFLEQLWSEKLDTASMTASSADELNQTASKEKGGEFEGVNAVTNLSAIIKRYQRANLKPGIVFVISDFLDREDFKYQLKMLAQAGFDLNLVQILTPAELSPEIKGDLMLVDSESGVSREVTISERVLKGYKTALDGYTTGLAAFCRSTGIGYAMFSVDMSFEDILLKRLIESRMAE